MNRSITLAVTIPSGSAPKLNTPRLRSRRLRTSLAGALALTPLVLVAGCGGTPAPRQNRIPVTVATVERRSVPLELVSTGTVEPAQSANVGSSVGGTVMSLAIREGQRCRPVRQ